MLFCFAAMQVDTTTMLCVGGAAVLAVYLTIRPKKNKKDPLDKPLGFSSLAQRREVERQMENVLVELSEMARQTTAQIDTRSAKLELLLGEAKETIARLEQLRDSGDAIAREAQRLMNPLADVEPIRTPTTVKVSPPADRLAATPPIVSSASPRPGEAADVFPPPRAIAGSRLDVVTPTPHERFVVDPSPAARAPRFETTPTDKTARLHDDRRASSVADDRDSFSSAGSIDRRAGDEATHSPRLPMTPAEPPHAQTAVVGHAAAEHRIPPPTVEQRIDAARRALAESVPARPAARMEPPPMTPPEANVLRDIDPRHAAVYALADRGRAAGDIATELGRPRGEIELILALRPKRPEAARE